MELIPNLIFLYHCMVASEHLLQEAAGRSVHGLKYYFLKHLQDERGHAEWLAEDLASIGIQVRKTRIPVEVLEMVGSVYYLIFHVDPAALLGYMQFMESGSPQRLPEWEKAYPASLLRTLKYHLEHDPAHLREINEVIGGMSSEQQALIAQTHQQSRQYFLRAFTSRSS